MEQHSNPIGLAQKQDEFRQLQRPTQKLKTFHQKAKKIAGNLNNSCLNYKFKHSLHYSPSKKLKSLKKSTNIVKFKDPDSVKKVKLTNELSNYDLNSNSHQNGLSHSNSLKFQKENTVDQLQEKAFDYYQCTVESNNNKQIERELVLSKIRNITKGVHIQLNSYLSNFQGKEPMFGYQNILFTPSDKMQKSSNWESISKLIIDPNLKDKLKWSIKQMKKLKDYDDYYSYLFKGFTYGINIRKIGNFDSIKQKIRNLCAYNKSKVKPFLNQKQTISFRNKLNKANYQKSSDSSLTSLDSKELKDTKTNISPEIIQKISKYPNNADKKRFDQKISQFCLKQNHSKTIILDPNDKLSFPHQPDRSRYHHFRGVLSESIKKPVASTYQTISLENLQKYSELQNTFNKLQFQKEVKQRRRGLFSKLYKSNTDIEIKPFCEFLKDFSKESEEATSNINKRFLRKRYTHYDLNLIMSKLNTFTEHKNTKDFKLNKANFSKLGHLNTNYHTRQSSNSVESLRSLSTSNYMMTVSKHQLQETPYASNS